MFWSPLLQYLTTSLMFPSQIRCVCGVFFSLKYFEDSKSGLVVSRTMVVKRKLTILLSPSLKLTAVINNPLQIKKWNKTIMCKYVKYVHLDLLKNSQENTTGLRRTFHFYQNCIKIVQTYYNSIDGNKAHLLVISGFYTWISWYIVS